jgi:hypothetical protein
MPRPPQRGRRSAWLSGLVVWLLAQRFSLYFFDRIVRRALGVRESGDIVRELLLCHVLDAQVYLIPMYNKFVFYVQNLL